MPLAATFAQPLDGQHDGEAELLSPIIAAPSEPLAWRFDGKAGASFALGKLQPAISSPLRKAFHRQPQTFGFPLISLDSSEVANYPLLTQLPGSSRQAQRQRLVQN